MKNLDPIELVELNKQDAPFILKLVNQRSFKHYIGDKKIHTIGDAEQHIYRNYTQSYNKNGYGLWGVRDVVSDKFVGVCGLVSRPILAYPDLGYALLDEYLKQGYIALAAKKTLSFALEKANLPLVNAITDPNNLASIKVLELLKFKFVEQFYLEGHEGKSNLYQRVL